MIVPSPEEEVPTARHVWLAGQATPLSPSTPDGLVWTVHDAPPSVEVRMAPPPEVVVPTAVQDDGDQHATERV